MRLVKYLGIAGISIAILAGSAFSQWPDKFKAGTIKKNWLRTPGYVADELLVKFRENITVNDLKVFNQQVRATANNRAAAIAAFHAYYQTTPKNKPIQNWQCLKIPAGQKLPEFLKRIEQNALVEKVEPNYWAYAAADLSTTYTAYAYPDDTYYRDGHTQWWLNRTKCDQAMNTTYVFTGASNVIVAMVDTGVDLDHPEFSGRLVAGYNVLTPAAQPEDDNQYIDTILELGHGTHGAGTIVAAVNNGSGVAGCAWDTRVKIMPVKVLYFDGSGTIDSVAGGIDWAANNGANIINISIEVYSDSTTLQNAVTHAQGLGCLVVAAAGNDNYNLRAYPIYPAVYPNVMSAGATYADDRVTIYSNWSDPAGLISCVAPGGALEEYVVGWDRDFGITSTAHTGSWSAVDGTSFAAPQVSALAAMLKLQLPSRTASDLSSLITSNCEPMPGEGAQSHGAGRINFARALGVYKTPTGTPTITQTFTITPTYTITPSFTITPTHTLTDTITPTSTITPTVTPLSFAAEELRIFPQPAKNYARVGFAFHGPGQVTLELYNVSGERVIQLSEQPLDRSGYAILELNTSRLGHGIYFAILKIEDASGKRTLKGKLAVSK